MSSFLAIQYLKSRVSANGSHSLVAYFFFPFISSGNTDVVKALLLDIISQLCQQLGPAYVLERVRTLLFTADDLRSRDYLIETVRDLFNKTEERGFLILDGLDDCSDEPLTQIVSIISYFLEHVPKLSITMSRPLAQSFGLASNGNRQARPMIILPMPFLYWPPEYVSARLRDLELPWKRQRSFQHYIMNQTEG